MMKEYIKIVIYTYEDIGDLKTVSVTVPVIISYALNQGESLMATVKAVTEKIKEELDRCGGVYE